MAIGVKPGDTLYNCFMEELKVDCKIVAALDLFPSKHYMKFIMKDRSGHKEEYDCTDLYFSNLEEEDDAEKSWVLWAKDNKSFFMDTKNISYLKEIFKNGFGRGFQYKQQITYEEMMQK